MEVILMDQECVLIRDFLSSEMQEKLFQFIQEHDKTPWETLPRAMVPSPKTLLFDEDTPKLKFDPKEKSFISDIVRDVNDILKVRTGSIRPRESSSTTDNPELVILHDEKDNNLDLTCLYKALTMAAIKYEAPDGKFPQHIDHCNKLCIFDVSWMYR
jgi:hypothetical protein